MKLRFSLLAPLCSAMVLVAITGCSDELVNGQESGRPQGNGIVFGASAGYADETGTRTAYGDYSGNDGYGNPTSQEILWVSGDRVEVYSPKSPNRTQVEYAISNINSTDGGSAYLAAYNGQDGLQWDFSSTTQDFYAVYPSPASITNQAMVQQYNIRLENGVLHGFIPTNQEYKFTKDGSADGGWRCEPTMDWQYMVARNEGFTVPTDGTDGAVSLDFNPLVTTLEITINGPSAPLAQLNVEAPDDKVIMGKFSCDLVKGWGENVMPDCTAEQTRTTTNYVTVNLYDTNGEPISLNANEHLTINVFLLPTKEWTDLEIRLAGYNTASKTLKLNSGASSDGTNAGIPITLAPHKKTRVEITAPVYTAGETNNWISSLNDNVLVSQLSIPGTANSFSYEYNGANAEWYKTQVATFEEQWNAGIRCFELRCAEPKDGNSLENQPLQCNRVNVGYTFGQAVDDIWQKVQHSGEFAMIIPSYESGTGHPADHNGVIAFANALNKFFESHAPSTADGYEYITYGSNVTVGDARGKLMFVARITSEEDEGALVEANINPVQGVFIEGWGSLKDLWKRRGYKYTDWATGGDNLKSSAEYVLMSEESNHTATLETLGPNNFKHTTLRAGNSQGTAYIQDWSRVSREGATYSFNTRRPFGIVSYDRTVYIYWPESFEEKCDDVWNTFTAAIAANSGQQADAFYINSLDGYFIDSNIPPSYIPYINGDDRWGGSASQYYNGTTYTYGLGGTAGNIPDFAQAINQDFFERIQDYGAENIYGPMNLVLLDYVYAEDDGYGDQGSRLASTIINNNFRFPLVVKEEATQSSIGSGTSSMGDGGDAIR